MTSTLLLSSLPMEKLPTMGRNDLGWLPTVSSSKSNLISGVFCPCALTGRLPVSAKTPKVTARSAVLMSRASMERTTGTDARLDGLRGRKRPNCCRASCQCPCSDDEQRQKSIEPGLGEIGPRLQRIPRIWVAVRNNLSLNAGETIDQGQHLPLTCGPALRVLTIIPIEHHPIAIRVLE